MTNTHSIRRSPVRVISAHAQTGFTNRDAVSGFVSMPLTSAADYLHTDKRPVGHQSRISFGCHPQQFGQRRARFRPKDLKTIQAGRSMGLTTVADEVSCKASVLKRQGQVTVRPSKPVSPIRLSVVAQPSQHTRQAIGSDAPNCRFGRRALGLWADDDHHPGPRVRLILVQPLKQRLPIITRFLLPWPERHSNNRDHHARTHKQDHPSPFHGTILALKS